ncbi:hypothetical protein [Bradyrhizobium yuanmingense]|uniref:Uncharacterized protein n=1 Tax=Bradyrhizobium yuanmingense TaxID=108015 RepID=A0ABV4GEU0_9BRAD|nr:hypothetical protein [Bradyrhizobium yuanmingense]
MTTRRTEFAAFVLDLMDFIEEKIAEALADEDSRAGAIAEGGTVPVLRDRLRENEKVQASFVLVASDKLRTAGERAVAGGVADGPGGIRGGGAPSARRLDEPPQGGGGADGIRRIGFLGRHRLASVATNQTRVP